MEYKQGMLVKSIAGHDQNHVYVIMKEEGDFLFLSDGRRKPVDGLKKKRKKHVQLIKTIPAELAELLAGGLEIRNENIRKAIGGKTHGEIRCN